MKPHARCALLAALAVAIGSAGPHAACPARAPTRHNGEAPERAAWLLLELPGGRVLERHNAAILRTPILPGSIAKLATLIAAVHSGAATSRTTMTCRRRIVVGGQTLVCTHPELGRPLTLAEALAHSCNYVFGSIAARLRREELDRALLSLGLPPSEPPAAVAACALGVRGLHATPEQLLRAFVRLAGESREAGSPASARDSGDRAGTSSLAAAIVLEGARGAADFGTARALGARGIDALAKTGTASMPGGGQLGIVLVVAPARHPARALVVVTPGAAGVDAAEVAAERLSRRAPPAPARSDIQEPSVLRVGTPASPGHPVIQRMDLEEYVARVVAAEGTPDAPAASLEALSLVARTFALANRGRHEREGFDLCDLTHCQALRAATAASRRAAAATRGRALRYGDTLASVFYSASCGGRSERPSRVWPGAEDPPYLVDRPEPDCRRSSSWRSEVRASDLVRALRRAGLRGEQVRNLFVRDRTPSGRVARIVAEGMEPGEMDGEAFRLAVGRALGWNVLKSTLFDMSRTATGYAFEGHGRGHGVGLCVVGATRQALAGRTAAEIVGAYFPGVVVGSVRQTDVRAGAPPPRGIVVTGTGAPGPRVLITLPSGEERERQRAQDIVAAAGSEYRKRWGLDSLSEIRVIFHATTEAYTRATGQPWWTAGASTGDRIDLIPPAALRERGTFERTLRHEVAHAMTARRLRGRPEWVREGAALYLSGEAGDAGAAARGEARGGGACPADGELRRPASQEAMRAAYHRSAVCFAAQLAAGRRWDEVK